MAKAVIWNNVSMLTPGMKNLGNQINKAFPDRDGTSDGAIGDYKHTQEKSGHNPDDTSADNAEWDGDSDNKPEVRAIDVDSDLNTPGVTMQNVIDHMRKLPNLGSVIRYMIYNKKIYRASNDFEPVAYTGASAHTEHAHFSGAYSDASDENTTFDFRLDELMALTDSDVDKIVEAVWNKLEVDPYDTSRSVRTGTWLRYVPSKYAVTSAVAAAKNDVLTALIPIAEKVDLDPSEIAAIKAALAVPTAQENADATVSALVGSGMAQLATALKNALSPEDLAQLIAELS